MGRSRYYIAYIETVIKDEPRTYNSVQLARKLKEERFVDLSSARLRDILKKKLSMEKNTAESSKTARSSQMSRKRS